MRSRRGGSEFGGQFVQHSQRPQARFRHVRNTELCRQARSDAFSISRSGLALSSLRQKAISSATAPTAVIPRTVRKLAGADFKLAHQIPL